MNITHAPCAFAVGEVWYEMPYGLVLEYRAKCGSHKNANIVQAMHDDGWQFTDTRIKTPYKDM